MKIVYQPMELWQLSDVMLRAYEFFQYSPKYSGISINREKLENLFMACASDHPSFSDYYCDLAIDVEDGTHKIVGGLVGMVTDYFFSDELMASEIAVFVDPDYRNSRIAVKLVDRFRQFAVDKNCTEVCIGATTGSHGDAYQRVLNRLGYETVGFVTKKTLRG